MNAFLASSSGRLLALAFAIAIAGTGVAKLIGPSGLAVGAICVLVAITIAIVAIATAVNEHPGPTAVALIGLPWLLFLGQVGQSLVSSNSAGYAFVVTGLAAAAFAMRPGVAAAPQQPTITVLHRTQRS
jgi:hypothetical protein